ncbi:MAG: hypothetical protein FWC38_00600 [Proteobacteria bacterium]|nr:hypothetical protein [Pseudomonadota bacterium]MCL2306741.1 hypothetical protein [Pseudomonadota bacterium]
MSKSSQVELILAKIESAYGDDANPTAALNAIRMANVQLTPYETETASLDYKKPTFGNNQQIVVSEQMRLTGEVYIVGGGEPGAVPPWGVLMRGCGWAETVIPDTSVIYNPISKNIESLTIYVNKDGILHKGTGCRGTVTWDFTAKKVPTFSFSFTGKFNPVEDQLMPPDADFSKWIKPRAAIPTFTGLVNIFGMVTAIVRSLTGDTQTEVVKPEWVNHDEIVISDRLPTSTVEYEARPVAEFDLYKHVREQTHGEVIYTHGNEPGNIIEMAYPDAILTSAEYGDNSKILTNTATIIPLIKDGNDDMLITVS